LHAKESRLMTDAVLTYHPAIISRRETGIPGQGLYLQLSTEGPPRWTDDPDAATTFASMREAARAAARLPAAVGAFGLPR
jgi:hypothetical protein